MNINNLTNNQMIKNYKELCNLLDITPTTGKAKQLQLKELSCYCNYTKQGNKYIINEIYTIPIEKIDNRIEGNHTKYVEHIKHLLLLRLSECEGYTCTIYKE